MKVLVNCEGETSFLEVSEMANVGDLKDVISREESYDREIQKLYLGSVELVEDEQSLEDAGILEGSFVNMKVSLLGGSGPVAYIDHLKELAIKFQCDKMICRKCYARLPKTAHNCRKRQCGHCPNIRPKKKIKEKEGKK